ncbi:hypothetical protein BJY52DRAFT_1228934 [Lactarius psammicola]|nr:hypothetical protein BJY52DRAFT_1228934 [Lactarius psammicola]
MAPQPFRERGRPAQDLLPLNPRLFTIVMDVNKVPDRGFCKGKSDIKLRPVKTPHQAHWKAGSPGNRAQILAAFVHAHTTYQLLPSSKRQAGSFCNKSIVKVDFLAVRACGFLQVVAYPQTAHECNQAIAIAFDEWGDCRCCDSGLLMVWFRSRPEPAPRPDAQITGCQTEDCGVKKHYPSGFTVVGATRHTGWARVQRALCWNMPDLAPVNVTGWRARYTTPSGALLQAPVPVQKNKVLGVQFFSSRLPVSSTRVQSWAEPS